MCGGLVRCHRAERLEQFADGAEAAEHHDVVATIGRAPCDLNGRDVEFAHSVFEAVHGEPRERAPEGIGGDGPRTGLDVAGENCLDIVGTLGIPELRSSSIVKSRQLELGAHGAIKDQGGRGG
ncbi:unannotated protein [freshwater metagenome]|uniref:Unannotated protein n=1 Tax=freshwater metagenome TaxID=449393 RepID=A0A6J7QBS3_9ZZZZ